MPCIRFIAAILAVVGVLGSGCGGDDASTPSEQAGTRGEADQPEPLDSSQQDAAAPEAEQPEAPTAPEPDQLDTEDADPDASEDDASTPTASAATVEQEPVEDEPAEQIGNTTTLPAPDTEQMQADAPPEWCAGFQRVWENFETAEATLEAAYARSAEASGAEAAEAADNAVFEAQYQMEVANSIREELVDFARMSTGDDPESLAYQHAWAALIAADPNIAELAASVPQDIAIGLDFAVPPLVVPEGATDEEAEAYEAAWRIDARRLIEDSNALLVAIYDSFASGSMSAFHLSLQESCGADQPAAEQAEEEDEQADASASEDTANPPQDEGQPADGERLDLLDATVTAIDVIDELRKRAVQLLQSGNEAGGCSIRHEAREVADAHQAVADAHVAAHGGPVLSDLELWTLWLDLLDEWDAACTSAGH